MSILVKNDSEYRWLYASFPCCFLITIMRLVPSHRKYVESTLEQLTLTHPWAITIHFIELTTVSVVEPQQNRWYQNIFPDWGLKVDQARYQNTLVLWIMQVLWVINIVCSKSFPARGRPGFSRKVFGTCVVTHHYSDDIRNATKQVLQPTMIIVARTSTAWQIAMSSSRFSVHQL